MKRSQESLAGLSYQIKTYEKYENQRLINDITFTEGNKKVLILSDDSVNEDSYDANVFVTLIELTKAFPKREGISFITELLDSRNLSSVHDFDIQNTIISNRMMSLLMCQLVMNKDSRNFFDDLLSVDLKNNKESFDIEIVKCNKLIVMSKVLDFKNKAELIQSFYNCFRGKKILIGYIHNSVIHFLDEEQDLNERVNIEEEDSFIYMKY